MRYVKISFLLLTILIIVLIYQNCLVEGLGHSTFKQHCIDDPNWFIVDKNNKKHTCSDIGKTISCYHRDNSQREGWERCKKTCGACDTALLHQQKHGHHFLPTFSGDPVEDFGVVLNISSSKHIPKHTTHTSKAKTKNITTDISNLSSKIKSTEHILNLISGNTVKCVEEPGRTKSKDTKEFYGCKNKLLTKLNEPTKKHSYIKKTKDNKLQFPLIEISCNEVKNGGLDTICDDYYLFNKSSDKKDKKDKKDKYEGRFTLGDMCPNECKSCYTFKGCPKPTYSNKINSHELTCNDKSDVCNIEKCCNINQKCNDPTSIYYKDPNINLPTGAKHRCSIEHRNIQRDGGKQVWAMRDTYHKDPDKNGNYCSSPTCSAKDLDACCSLPIHMLRKSVQDYYNKAGNDILTKSSTSGTISEVEESTLNDLFTKYFTPSRMDTGINMKAAPIDNTKSEILPPRMTTTTDIINIDKLKTYWGIPSPSILSLKQAREAALKRGIRRAQLPFDNFRLYLDYSEYRPFINTPSDLPYNYQAAIPTAVIDGLKGLDLTQFSEDYRNKDIIHNLVSSYGLPNSLKNPADLKSNEGLLSFYQNVYDSVNKRYNLFHKDNSSGAAIYEVTPNEKWFNDRGIEQNTGIETHGNNCPCLFGQGVKDSPKDKLYNIYTAHINKNTVTVPTDCACCQGNPDNPVDNRAKDLGLPGAKDGKPYFVQCPGPINYSLDGKKVVKSDYLDPKKCCVVETSKNSVYKLL